MTASTRSDLLFAALAGGVTYGLAGGVPAVVVAVVALLVTFGIAGPASAVREAAASAWDAMRGVGSIRGASLSMRWVVVLFLAGVLVGRGFDGVTLPRIVLPQINWPTITLPDVVRPTPAPETPKATAATFVYEKDSHGVPGYVLGAFNKLNRGGQVVATLLESDPEDGTGEVPDQYKAPLAAAKQAGLPALVVTSGSEVLSVLKDPKDEQAVLDAVK